MSWITGGAERASHMALLPAFAAAFDDLYASLWRQPHLPAPVLELCRLRLAQLHNSALDLSRCDVQLDAAKKEALRHWHKAALFSPGERACLGFTEVYAMDAQSITDEHARAVKDCYGEAGLVLLIEALGVLDGMMRQNLLWQLSDEVADGR